MNGLRDNDRLAGPHLIARKTSDESVTSSTVLQDDNELFTPSIAANEVWQLKLYIRFQGATPSIKYSFSFPTGAVLDITSLYVDTGGTTWITATEATVTDGSVLTILGGTNPRLIPVEMLFVNSTNAGAITFRWAQNTSSGTSTIVKANSTLWGMKLA
jgi:hypothetical protein